MLKELGAKAFSYGYASPVLMAATYNDDGTVNVMNLHEVARTNAGDLACCIGKPKKTHENIEKRKAFTLTLANEALMKEIDYLGTVSGYKVPDKFERTGLKAEKSKHVDAPIIVGSPVVIECELIEFVETENFTPFAQVFFRTTTSPNSGSFNIIRICQFRQDQLGRA